MALAELAGRGAEADLLRDMIQYVAQRLMDLSVENLSLNLTARLVSSIPGPRVNLTRFHGVFALSSSYRVLVTTAAVKAGRMHQQNSAKRQLSSG